MTKVLVLFGGDSPERPISIRSADSVIAALKTAGFDVTSFDTANPISALVKLFPNIDIVFPVLHGIGGEDGSIQKILEDNNVPFVGSGSQASLLCFDKWAYKQLLKDSVIPQAEGAIVSKLNFLNHPLTQKPFVIKPNDGGSSIDTYIIRDANENSINSCLEAFTRHEAMLIESLIVGTEITVGVLGKEALPVIEIIPPSGKEFDLENKYNGATQELCPPVNVSKDLQEKTKQIALKVHEITGCKDMSRTDMMIDNDGNIYVLETNTIPGMTPQSLLPKAALQAGMAMPELVTRLVNLT